MCSVRVECLSHNCGFEDIYFGMIEDQGKGKEDCILGSALTGRWHFFRKENFCVPERPGQGSLLSSSEKQEC